MPKTSSASGGGDPTTSKNDSTLEGDGNQSVNVTLADLEKMIDSKISASKLSASSISGPADNSFVAPPVLGDVNSLLNSKIIKEISAVITKTSLLTENDGSGSNMKSLLQIAKTHIESNGLDEEAAFSFMINLTPPVSSDMLLALKQMRVPFSRAWLSLQKSQISNVSLASLRKDLEKIFSSPSPNLGQNLREIISLNHRIGERNVLDSESERMNAITLACKADMLRFLYSYYPFNVSNIENCYYEAKRESLGDDESDFHPVTTLLELACDKLANISPQPSKGLLKIETRTMGVANSKKSSGKVSKSSNADSKAPKRAVCWLCATPNHTLNVCRRFADKRYDKSVTCPHCSGHHLATPCYKLRNPPQAGNGSQGFHRRPDSGANRAQINMNDPSPQPTATPVSNQNPVVPSQENNQRN